MLVFIYLLGTSEAIPSEQLCQVCFCTRCQEKIGFMSNKTTSSDGYVKVLGFLRGMIEEKHAMIIRGNIQSLTTSVLRQ